LVISSPIEHPSQFKRMYRTGVVPQNVAEHMQRGKGNPIGLRERRDRASLYGERRSPIPSFTNVWYPDAIAIAAPDAAMQFDGDRKVRIEVIPAPLPDEGLYQRPRVFV